MKKGGQAHPYAATRRNYVMVPVGASLLAQNRNHKMISKRVVEIFR